LSVERHAVALCDLCHIFLVLHIPKTLIDPDMPVLRAEGVHIHRQLGVVTHRARTLSNAARAMIDSVTAKA